MCCFVSYWHLAGLSAPVLLFSSRKIEFIGIIRYHCTTHDVHIDSCQLELLDTYWYKITTTLLLHTSIALWILTRSVAGEARGGERDCCCFQLLSSEPTGHRTPQDRRRGRPDPYPASQPKPYSTIDCELFTHKSTPYVHSKIHANWLAVCAGLVGTKPLCRMLVLLVEAGLSTAQTFVE